MTSAIEVMARFAAQTPSKSIPQEVRDFAATLILDLLAAASAGISRDRKSVV